MNLIERLINNRKICVKNSKNFQLIITILSVLTRKKLLSPPASFHKSALMILLYTLLGIEILAVIIVFIFLFRKIIRSARKSKN